jgi:hypothetical protein
MSDTHCRWCGERKTTDSVSFCSACGKPVLWFGYLAYSVKILVVPLSLAVITFLFSTTQSAKDASIEDARRLSQAFTSLGDIESRMSADEAWTALMYAASRPPVSEQDLESHVLDSYEMFQKYEPTLGPFEEYDSRVNGRSTLTDVWKYCFLIPFYGPYAPAPLDLSYWETIKAQFAQCDGKTCPPTVVKAVRDALWASYSGTCACQTPDKVPIQIPRDWFWQRMRSLMMSASTRSDSTSIVSFGAKYAKFERAKTANGDLSGKSGVECPKSLVDESARLLSVGK